MASKLITILLSLWAHTAVAEPVMIACLGDSITLTAPTRSAIPWPNKLEILLNTAHPGEYAVGNFGVLATTSAQHLTTWTNSIRGKGYDAIVILSGINDVITDVPAVTTWANIEQITSEALSDGLTVVLVTILPWKSYTSWTAGRQIVTDALLTSLRARASVTIVDLYPSFETTAGSDILLVAYDAGDGLHPGETNPVALTATGAPGTNAIATAIKTGMGL